MLNSISGNGDSPRKGGWGMRIGLISICLVSVLLFVAAENTLAEQPGSEEPLDIGSRLELFVDNYLIEFTEGVRLKLHSPRSAGKVLTLANSSGGSWSCRGTETTFSWQEKVPRRTSTPETRSRPRRPTWESTKAQVQRASR